MKTSTLFGVAFSISRIGSGFGAFQIPALGTRLFSMIMISWLVPAVRKKMSAIMPSAMIAPSCLVSSKLQCFFAECLFHPEFLLEGSQNPSLLADGSPIRVMRTMSSWDISSFTSFSLSAIASMDLT